MRWSSPLFGLGNQDSPDAPGGVPLGLASDRGPAWPILQLLGLDLEVPDHSTPSRRADRLEVPRTQSCTGPIHLLVDSTGLRLCGPGEWLGICRKSGVGTREWQVFVTRSCSEPLELLGKREV
jgi:hypothetical protein